MASFKELEAQPKGFGISIDEAIENIKFNEDGLVPAIAQQFDTGEVLMMAWMNEKSIKETLETQHVCYWSRSRQTYWRKGESSGHRQILKSLKLDCDGDAILLSVDQTGAACHTFRKSCFYWEAKDGKFQIISEAE